MCSLCKWPKIPLFLMSHDYPCFMIKGNLNSWWLSCHWKLINVSYCCCSLFLKAALNNTGIPRAHVAAGALGDRWATRGWHQRWEFLQFYRSDVLVIVTLTKVTTWNRPNQRVCTLWCQEDIQKTKNTSSSSSSMVKLCSISWQCGCIA